EFINLWNKLIMSSIYGSSCNTQLISGMTINKPMTLRICKTPCKSPTKKLVLDIVRMTIPEVKINKGNLKFLNETVPSVNKKINIPDIDNMFNNIGTGKKAVNRCKIRKVKIEMRNPQTMKGFMMTFHPIYKYN